MNPLPALADDQAAMISLLLRQRHSYADVARLLGIDEQAVAARARAAVDVLAPRETTRVSPAEQELLADHLLGQLPASAPAVRRLLDGSRAARVWARHVAGALETLSTGALPLASASRAPVSSPVAGPPPVRAAPPSSATDASGAGASSRPGPREAASDAPSSRRGGAALLVAMAVILVVAVVLVTRSGEGTGQGVVSGPAPGVSTPAATAPAPFRVLASSALTGGPAGGRAHGVVEIISQGSQRALAVAGTGLTPTAGLSRSGFDYTLWLSGSGGAHALGIAPAVARDGKLQALGPLPTATSGPQTVLITRETVAKPTSPGPAVLSGRLPSA